MKRDLKVALIAHWKQVATIHDGFMRLAMAFVVDDFIDSTFQHRLSWQEHCAVLRGFAAMAPLFVSARHQRPVKFFARGGFG